MHKFLFDKVMTPWEFFLSVIGGCLMGSNLYYIGAIFFLAAFFPPEIFKPK